MKRFIADRKGAFAMQFALLVVPLTVCTGLAIDGGRAFLARYELAAALDAAALAVGSTFNEDTDLNVVAHSFVNANFHTEHNGPIDLELTVDDGEDDNVLLRGTVTIDTYFMPLVGQPTVTVSAESQVKKGGANVEVALALDVTGSMDEKGPDGVKRIDGLKSAAKLLIDKVVNPIQTPYFSKAAIVPWSQSVYAGDKHVDADVHEDLRGTLTGPTSITSASWRKTATSTKTILEAGWRTSATAGGKSISGASWKNGSAKTISTITKLTGPSRIRVSASSHGYASGDYVRITGAGGSYTGLNNNIYVVEYSSSSQFYLRTLDNSAYVTPPSGSTDSSSGSSQRCFDNACNVAITTSSSHTLSVGDFAHITGVNGFTEVNNADDQSWVVASVLSSTVYTISGLTGPGISSTYSSSSSDKSSECYVSNCRYRVTTSASHGFSTSDYIFIWSLSESGSGTSGVSALNSTWSVENPSGSVFYLPGNGVNYRDWTSGGYAAQCAYNNCNVRVTSAGHGLSAGEFVRIRSATGLSGINNCDLDTAGRCASGSTPVAWEIAAVSGDDLRLKDSGPSYPNVDGTYGSSGTTQCTRYGCEVFRFVNSSNNARVYQPTKCLVERYGSDAYKDTDPASAPLGINYTGDGTCAYDDNYVTPLTSSRSRLNTAIDDLVTGGSTGGQIGVGWGWYMLSSNFDSAWSKEAENKAKPYGTKELAKVLVLMTDGEFNFRTCSGVTSSSINSSYCELDSDPFKQAEEMCDAVKKKNIIIYTVGLELDTSLYSDDFLIKCATSPQHAYLASSNTELEEAFKKIAKEISKLRIAH
ncbi:MAG TPA: pilus assembly protein [Hyphomonadaceae bacterium]|nr:pilus assembly protein [Hyphomonadaceae bacterium]